MFLYVIIRVFCIFSQLYFQFFANYPTKKLLQPGWVALSFSGADLMEVAATISWRRYGSSRMRHDFHRNSIVEDWNASNETKTSLCRSCDKYCHEAFSGDVIVSAGNNQYIITEYQKVL